MSKVFTSKDGKPMCNVSRSDDSPVFVITMTNGDDNRLNTDFCQAMLRALDYIEHMYETCPDKVRAVVTTGAVQKFYSNGLDLEHAVTTPGFWQDSFYCLLRRVLQFQLPMIAAVNGHAFAGGLMFAMCHDYRIGNKERGFLCLNEVHFGAPLLPGMLSTVSSKVSPQVLRKCVLEGHRFGGAEQAEAGFVDAVVPPDHVLKAAIRLGTRVAQFAKSEVYGKLKVEINKRTIDLLTMEEHDLHLQRMLQYDSKL